MDTYLEHMIKQKKSRLMIAGLIGLYLVALLLSVLIFALSLASPMLMQFALPIAVAFFFGAYWITRQFSLEYEYIVTNDELDVDRIVARKSRKRLVTVSVRKFDVFRVAEGKHFEESLKNPEISVKLDASQGAGSVNRYYAIFENKQGRRMLLVFNPTRAMLNAFKRYNPSVVEVND